MADPLSFFSCNDVTDSSSSERSSDEDESTKKASYDKEHFGGDVSASSLLPPPLEALSTAKVPKFVTSHLTRDLNWDAMHKAAPEVEEKEYKPWESALPAVSIKSKVRDHRPDIALTKQVPQTLVPKPANDKKESESALTTESSKKKDLAISWSKMYADTSSEDIRNKTKRPRMNFDDPELNEFCYTDVNKDKKAFSKTPANQAQASGKLGWKKFK